jgi:hypothetical protein
MNPKMFPTIMIVLSICATVIYALNEDLRHTLYWLSSALIIWSVTY